MAQRPGAGLFFSSLPVAHHSLIRCLMGGCNTIDFPIKICTLSCAAWFKTSWILSEWAKSPIVIGKIKCNALLITVSINNWKVPIGWEEVTFGQKSWRQKSKPAKSRFSRKLFLKPTQHLFFRFLIRNQRCSDFNLFWELLKIFFREEIRRETLPRMRRSKDGTQTGDFRFAKYDTHGYLAVHATYKCRDMKPSLRVFLKDGPTPASF